MQTCDQKPNHRTNSVDQRHRAETDQPESKQYKVNQLRTALTLTTDRTSQRDSEQDVKSAFVRC